MRECDRALLALTVVVLVALLALAWALPEDRAAAHLHCGPGDPAIAARKAAERGEARC